MRGSATSRRGFDLEYTREISTEIHWSSITLLLAFEWNCKVLKRQRLGNLETEIINVGKRQKAPSEKPATGAPN
jgi:hypothetical protein